MRDVLNTRLADLNETASQLLSTAAVIGRSFDFATLQAASGRSELEAVAGLETLLASGLILERRGQSAPGESDYDFTHEKLRSLVYESTSLARRRLLHRRVAETLAGPAPGRTDSGSLAAQIAGHYHLAGQDVQAAGYFKAAGDAARLLFANNEALSHYRAALAAGYPDAAELHTAIGDLYVLRGEYEAAISAYETAAALCAPSGLPSIEHRLGEVHARRGEWELAECHFEAALEEYGSAASPAALAPLYSDWSWEAHLRGEAERALGLATRALAAAESSADQPALAQAYNLLGILHRRGGDLEQAAQYLQRSLQIAEARADPALRAAALNNLAQVSAQRGDLDGAIRLTATALELCSRQGDRHHEAALHNNLADLYHAAGQPEQAMAHLKQAVVIFYEIGAAGSAAPAGGAPAGDLEADGVVGGKGKDQFADIWGYSFREKRIGTNGGCPILDLRF